MLNRAAQLSVVAGFLAPCLLSVAGCPADLAYVDLGFGVDTPETGHTTNAAIDAGLLPRVSADANGNASSAAPASTQAAPGAASSVNPPADPNAAFADPSDSLSTPAPQRDSSTHATTFQGIVIAPSYIAVGPTASVLAASYPAFAGWRNEDQLTVNSAGELANVTRGGSARVSYLGDVLSVTSIAEITMDIWGIGWNVRFADGTSYKTDLTYNNWPGDQVVIVWDTQTYSGAMYMVNITRNQHVLIYSSF